MVHQLTAFSELDSDYNLVLLYLDDERDGITMRMTTVSWPSFTKHFRDSMGPTSLIYGVEKLDHTMNWFQSCTQSLLRYATNVASCRSQTPGRRGPHPREKSSSTPDSKILESGSSHQSMFVTLLQYTETTAGMLSFSRST